MFSQSSINKKRVNNHPGEDQEIDDDDDTYEENFSEMNVSDNGIGYFDPPIENYRFYYPGSGSANGDNF